MLIIGVSLDLDCYIGIHIPHRYMQIRFCFVIWHWMPNVLTCCLVNNPVVTTLGPADFNVCSSIVRRVTSASNSSHREQGDILETPGYALRAEHAHCPS